MFGKCCCIEVVYMLMYRCWCIFSVVNLWFIGNGVAMWLYRCCCIDGVVEMLLLIGYDVDDNV